MITVKDTQISTIWQGWIDSDDLIRIAEHPLMQNFCSNKPTLELLKKFLVQQYFYSRNFTRYLCSLIYQFDNINDVHNLMENLLEEMGVDKPGLPTHAELFQKVLRVANINPVLSNPLQETQQLIDSMFFYCQSSDPVKGLAAMCLGAEAIVQVFYKPVYKALKHFNFNDEEILFFPLHIEEDENHAITMIKILEKLTQDSRLLHDEAVSIGKIMIQHRLNMFTAIFDEVNFKGCNNSTNIADKESSLKYSSTNFNQVPEILSTFIPDKLIHCSVINASHYHDSFSVNRRHPVHIVDLPSHTLSMTIGELSSGQETRLHRHNYETIIYIISGQGYSLIGNQKVKWENGDAIYVPVWSEHKHVNSGDEHCVYIACENAPLLQNLGGIALRQELD